MTLSDRQRDEIDSIINDRFTKAQIKTQSVDILLNRLVGGNTRTLTTEDGDVETGDRVRDYINAYENVTIDNFEDRIITAKQQLGPTDASLETLEELVTQNFSNEQLRDVDIGRLIERATNIDSIATELEENDTLETEDLREILREKQRNAPVDEEVTVAEGRDDSERPPDSLIEIDEPVLDGVDFESVETEVIIGNATYDIIEYECELDLSDSANMGKAVVYPRGSNKDDQAPNYDQDFEARVKIVVDEETQSIPERNEMFNEWITIFNGRINNYRSMGYNQWHIEFTNFSADILHEHTSVRNSNVTRVRNVVEDIVDSISREPADIRFHFGEGAQRFDKPSVTDELFTNEAYEEEQEAIETAQDVAGLTDSITDELSDRVTGIASNQATDTAGLAFNTISDSIEQKLTSTSFSGNPAQDVQVKFTREQQKAADILDELATFANAHWWVDRENVFHFGKLETAKRELKFITDASDGQLTPAYRSVVVIGDGVVAEDGWGFDHLESNETPVVAARISNVSNEEPDIIPNQIQEPVFEYKNKDIKTPEQLKKVAESLAEDLAEQLEGGEITIVGRSDVRVLDSMIIPEFLTPDDESYEYSIGGVKHILNGQDGFVTKLQPFHDINQSNDVTRLTDALQIGPEIEESDEDETEQYDFETAVNVDIPEDERDDDDDDSDGGSSGAIDKVVGVVKSQGPITPF